MNSMRGPLGERAADNGDSSPYVPANGRARRFCTVRSFEPRGSAANCWKPATDKAGLASLRFHDLRRTFVAVGRSATHRWCRLLHRRSRRAAHGDVHPLEGRAAATTVRGVAAVAVSTVTATGNIGRIRRRLFPPQVLSMRSASGS